MELHFSMVNSQVMVKREGRLLCLQPLLPPLCCGCSLWVCDVDHISQLILSGWTQHIKSSCVILILEIPPSTKQHNQRKHNQEFHRRDLTCSLPNTPDLLLPKPYFCRALSSSSVLSLYTSCSTCQSKSSSSSSSSSPGLSLHPFAI